MLSKNGIEDMLSAVSSKKKRKRKLAVVIKHLNKGQLGSFGDRITDHSLQEAISTQLSCHTGIFKSVLGSFRYCILSALQYIL